MSIKPFEGNSKWMNKVDFKNDNIDFFFTQRKVVECVEYIDESNLERKEKKKTVMYNFLAINLPTPKKYYEKIKIEIWGDKELNYIGELLNIKGSSPNFMIKLNDDTQIFVKLIYDNNDDDIKTYYRFIPVLKRYQKI